MTVFVTPDSLCQIEIYVSSLGVSLEFYEKVFGWKKVPAYMHNLCVLDVKDSKIGVALVPSITKANQKSTLFFRVESAADVEQILKIAEKLTGKKPKRGRFLPGFGTVTYVIDPDGHRLGLFTP